MLGTYPSGKIRAFMKSVEGFSRQLIVFIVTRGCIHSESKQSI